jgi:signal transduction histidine kinase/ActR/RegA family two-component response regulator
MDDGSADRLLMEARALFVSVLDSQAILERLARLAVPAFADACLVHRNEGDEAVIRLVNLAHDDPAVEARLREVALRRPFRMGGDSAVARVLRGGPGELYEWISEAQLRWGWDEERASLLRSMDLRSAMVVPVRGRTGVLAAITFLCGSSGRRYGRPQMEVAVELARQAGLPLDNARLFEAERRARQGAESAAAEAARAAERTGRLQQLTAALGAAVTPEEAARVAANLGRATLGASSGFVWFLSPDGAHLDLAAADGRHAPHMEPSGRFARDRALPLCDALRDGVPVLLPSPEVRWARYPDAGEGGPSRGGAWAAIPLAVGDRLLGGLSLTFEAPRAFRPEDERLMLMLAQQCAQAVERTRLFDAERAARARAERLVEQTRRMQLVTSELSQALPPEEVAQIVCEEGAAVLGATRMGIWMLDDDTRSLALLGSRGYGPAALARYACIGLDGCAPLAEAVQTREPIWLQRRSEYALAFPEAEAQSRALSVDGELSCAFLPLVVQGRVLAALAAEFPQPGALDDEVRPFLLALAHHCAQALDRHHLLTDLRDAEEAARAADRRKDQFLALLGHELRNPLSPILTAVELMKMRGGKEDEEEREVIERQARHLVRLVDDLLDISRITRGRIELRRRRLDVREVIDQALETTGPLLEKHHHHLDVQVPATGLRVMGDEARLVQVFQNLLTNAAKYTPPGGHIHVGATTEEGEVVVRIRDDGAGIPSDLLAAIFEPFVQGERTLDRAQGGMGIGLPLVRNMVRLHGGRVSACSDGDGLGSEFVVRLPSLDDATIHGERRARSSFPPPPLHTLRVLVVDDNPDVARMVAGLLRQHGHDVIVRHDGPSAIEAARAHRPEVALLDIGLPVMNGYELAERLRTQAASHPPVMVAITGYGQDVDRRRSLRAGFAEHLVKPVDGPHLLALLTRLGGRQAQGQPVA